MSCSAGIGSLSGPSGVVSWEAGEVENRATFGDPAARISSREHGPTGPRHPGRRYSFAAPIPRRVA